MSWPRLQVKLVGDDEPLTVQTNAIDHAPIPVNPAEPKGLDFLFRLAHNALVRVGADVPRHYDKFLEVLDEVPTPLDEDDPAILDPTPTALSVTQQ